MCGLFGTVLRGNDPSQVVRARNARDSLTHRGPDQAGEWICGGVYMGHRRLSILDLSDAGRQPMVSDDGMTGISINGEIYNFKTLRDELENAGHIFKSKSDSEVVLHGYLHWGLEGLAQRLDGMYVAVIYDHRRNCIHIIRDRAGIKPLYYHHNGQEFSWASELKALDCFLPAEKKIVDRTAFYDFLIYRYIPAPKSMYKNIYKLQAGSLLTLRLDSGNLDVRKYWNLPVCERSAPHDQLAEELVSLMQKSVEEQVVSDVPVGFFLSGGMDSSVIAAHMAKMDIRCRAFSIGFDDKLHDETHYARLVAERLGIPHTVKILGIEEIENIFGKLRAWYDEPFSDTSAIPTFRVSELARQSVTVSLSGDGGDELFGGYNWYTTFNKIRAVQKYFPAGCRAGWPLPDSGISGRIFRLSIRDPLELYAVIRSGLPAHRRQKYRERWEIPDDYDDMWHYRAHWNPEYGAWKSLQALDFCTYLSNNILTKIDRLSMAVSLEARVPFLSKDLIEFAFSLPESFLYREGQLKGGMKYAYRDRLPAEILNRSKKGFSMPIDSWRERSLGSAGSFQEAALQEYSKFVVT